MKLRADLVHQALSELPHGPANVRRLAVALRVDLTGMSRDQIARAVSAAANLESAMGQLERMKLDTGRAA